jgi:hypothetical protein
MSESVKKSRQSLDGEIIKIRRGLAIYKIHASPFYMARVLNPAGKPKYIVKSTKEKSRLQARVVAEEIAAHMLLNRGARQTRHLYSAKDLR